MTIAQLHSCLVVVVAIRSSANPFRGVEALKPIADNLVSGAQLVVAADVAARLAEKLSVLGVNATIKPV